MLMHTGEFVYRILCINPHGCLRSDVCIRMYLRNDVCKGMFIHNDCILCMSVTQGLPCLYAYIRTIVCINQHNCLELFARVNLLECCVQMFARVNLFAYACKCLLVLICLHVLHACQLFAKYVYKQLHACF